MMCCSFQLNNFTQVNSLFKILDAFPMFKTQGEMADRVTSSYYFGRKALFDGKYKDADTELSFAFTHCYQSSIKNKRLILIYLIPVKLLHGHIPSDELLQTYDLPQLIPIAHAVKDGNISALKDALAQHQMFFIQWGIFLLLERLRMITYRNLFKKVSVSPFLCGITV